MASLTILSGDRRKVEFTLSGASFPLANALRRAAISETPTVAVGSVEIRSNATIACDELLAQRAGLVPVRAPPGTRDAVLEIDATNEGGQPRWLMSQEIVCPPGLSVMGDIPIVRLGPGHGVRMKLRLTSGTGQTHARFSPGLVSRYSPLGDGSFDMALESKGGVPAMDILTGALQVLQGRARRARELVEQEAATGP